MYTFYNIGIAIQDKRSQEYSYLHGVQSLDFDFSQDLFKIKDIGRDSSRYVPIPHTGTINITRVFSVLHGDQYRFMGPFLSHIFAFNGLYSLDGPNTYKHSKLFHSGNLGHSISGDSANDLREFNFYLAYTEDDEEIVDSRKILELNNCLLTRVEYTFTPEGAPIETLSFSYNGRKFGDNVTFSKDMITLKEGDYAFQQLIRGRDFAVDLSNLPPPTNDLLHAYRDSLVHGIKEISLSCSINYTDTIDTGVWNGSGSTSPNLWKTMKFPLDISTSIKYSVENKIFDQLALVKNTDTIYENLPIRYVFRCGKYNTTEISNYFVLNLGKKNRLTSISRSSISTDSGEPEEVTCNYINYNNDFAIYFTDNTNFTIAEDT